MIPDWLGRCTRTVGATAVGGLAALLLTAGAAVAQEGAIAGSVVSEDLVPLDGAQVFIPGTNLGALTNAEGRYRIEGVPAGEVEVRVRLIGYRAASQNVNVAAGQVATADFTLDIAAITLDEVVATIAGEQRERTLGYTSVTIDADAVVEASKPQSVTDLIKGRSPGVVVRRSSGSVGTGSEIKVRGAGSISLSNVPLIVVDGAIVNNDNQTGLGVGGQAASRLNDLNPDDIESIEIVKGPAASALWGSASTSGVIRITTKKGQGATTRYSFRGEAGGNWDVTEWPSSFWHPRSLLGAAATDTLYEMNLLRDLDPFRTGLLQTYGASIRGGLENVGYYLSGEYNRENGNLPNNRFIRWTARGNFSITPSDKVDISVSNGFTSNFLRLPDNDNNGFGYIGVALIGFPWQVPITRSDPNTGGDPIETCPLAFEISRQFGVPLTSQAGQCPGNAFFGNRTFDDVSTLTNEQSIERYTGSATASYRPFDFWTNRVTVGYDELADRLFQLVPVDPDRPFGVFSNGDVFKFQSTDRNLTVTASSTLDFDITGDISSSFTAGGQYFKTISEQVDASGQVFPGPSPTVGNSVTNQGDDSFFEVRSLGWFFQEQLGFMDRLFIVPAVRFEDNSAVGEALTTQIYPQVAGSYVISEEGWFPSGINTLKLRAAWGQSGKRPGPNDAFALLTSSATTFFNNDVLGFSPNRPGNEELKAERASEIEAGFDVGILDGRVGLEVTYYNQETEDAIVTRPLAPSLGFPGARFTNIGKIRNRGIEFGLDVAALDRRDLRWDWRVNFSTLDNEILELDEPIIYGLGGSSQRHTVGFPFGSYFAEEIVVGADGEAEILTCDQDPSRGCDPQDSHRFIGDPNPEWEGSVSTTVRLLDHITVYGLLDFQGGFQLFNSTEEFRCGFLGGGEFGGLCGEMFETGPGGERTDEAKIKGLASDILSEAPWFEDADFAKLRTVSVRFDIPRTWLQPWGADRVSLSLVGENLATWTSYEGLDPEINWAGQNEGSRAEFLTLPPARRVLATVSVTF